MRLDTLLTLAILASTSAGSVQPDRRPMHHRYLSRSRRLLEDIGIAVSGLFTPRKLVSPSASSATSPVRRSIIKRGGVMSHNQCVLKNAQGPLALPGRGGGGGGGQPTSGVNATTTGSSSSTKSRTSTSSTKTGGTSGPTTTSGSGSGGSSSPYKKVLDASGSDFFDSWTFWSDADPTHGTVQYTTQSQAEAADLIEVNGDGHAILRVETTPQVTGYRKSVRIETSTTHTGGLWVLDAVHMPVGCGIWPAFWTHGPSWPENGEIDILEGVHDSVYNQASLHAAVGCTLAPGFTATGTSLNGANCAALQTGNQGCGIKDSNPNSYGNGFNKNGGGVYAMLWDDAAVSVFFFPRGSVPKDLSSEQPMPQNWGLPSAQFPASTCAPFQYNKDHKTIINTTLCGDWAGGAWGAPQNDGSPSCQQKTGFADCASYVASQGSTFGEAYWQIRSMKIYQLK